MKTFNVSFENGHFIDRETGERIIPMFGANYTLSGADESFTKEDFLSETETPLTSQEKQAEIFKDFGPDYAIKIMNAGDRLFFRLGLRKPVHGRQTYQYIFLCLLLEDLYLVCNNRIIDNTTGWTLSKSKCQLTECIEGGVAISDKIKAESLNDLFSKTVQSYFSKQRCGSVNVFKSFFLYQDAMKITFQGISNHMYRKLEDVRNDEVAKRKDHAAGLFAYTKKRSESTKDTSDADSLPFG
jgi:hypothetical protein